MLRGGARGGAATGLIPSLLHVEPPAELLLLQLPPLMPRAAAQPVGGKNDMFGSRRKETCRLQPNKHASPIGLLALMHDQCVVKKAAN